ncbi:MAG: hypothetical protein NVV73_00375 [Cellvibrionaceae bacterium]|nr:hypothetical protein [Cellvibrionaceae bacterium]
MNKECKNLIFVQVERIDPDFEYICDKCGFEHKAGETTTLYNYELIDERDKSLIEAGSFQLLHDDYVGESKEYKYCIVCGALKPFELFDVHGSRQTGRQGECRLCKQVYNGIKNQTRLTEQHREASQKRRLYTHFEDREKMDVAIIYARFGNCCFKCGTDLSSDLTAGAAKKEGNLDHTLPVFYLWPLTTDSATLLCREHNGEKAEKWPGAYYTDAELRRLSALTGIEHRLMAGAPRFNPIALAKLRDAAFIESLFEKFARYPHELLRLRNRILAETGFDFLDINANISPEWRRRADEL